MLKVLIQCIPYLIGFCFKEVGYTLCTALGVIVCIIQVAGTLIGAGAGTNQPGQMVGMITNVIVTVVFLCIYVNRSKKLKSDASPEPAKAPASAAEPSEAAGSNPANGGAPSRDEAEKEPAENHGSED